MNAYELLECGANSTPDEIKSAYHRLLLVHHPDKKLDRDREPSCIDKFLQLTSAYKILSDPAQRQSYDALLKQIDLKSKANLINDDDKERSDYFLLSKDFELNEKARVYARKCRCGSVYKINMNDINELLNSHNSHDEKRSSPMAESLVVNIECDTCSININVLVI